MNSHRLLVVSAAFVFSISTVSISATSMAGSRGSKPSSPKPSPTKLEIKPDFAVRLTPAIATSPAYVQALVQVPHDADNRLLRVIIDSEDYYRSSDIQLDGAEAPRNHLVAWKTLPSGIYFLRVELYGSTGLRKVITAGPTRVI